MIVVPPRGNQPNLVLLVGERPGYWESQDLKPFVGPSGADQEAYLRRYNVNPNDWRITNVCQSYDEHNADPTVNDIREWTPKLIEEIGVTRPKLIVPVGRYAARWFLGNEVEMSLVHGIPHKAGAFDERLKHRGLGATILPIHHPAAAYHDKTGAVRSLIAWDYERLASVYKTIRAGGKVHHRVDEWEGKEKYRDVTGSEFADYIEGHDPIAVDTEGVPGDEWSIQASVRPGEGVVLRICQPDFKVGVQALQLAVDNGITLILHNASSPSGCMYDYRMSRGMGLELRDAKIVDTMYLLFLLRLESQGLKQAGWRWCGMKMRDFEEVVGDVGKAKQMRYLEKVVEGDWPKPEPRVEFENDGTFKLKKPNSISQLASKILLDVYTDKVTKDGPTDPMKRWMKVDDVQRVMVEKVLGKMPVGTLNDIPLNEAIDYACRDVDAGIRVAPVLIDELKRLGGRKLELAEDGMQNLAIFEEMQETGLPADKQAFIHLRDELDREMVKLQAKISKDYFGGRPFNPKSPNDTDILRRRRGLEAAKTTKTGRPSTSKASLEHHRYYDEAFEDVFTWRELAHTKDMFCEPTLDLLEDQHSDSVVIRGAIKPTTIPTRRIAMIDPNLLAVSKHSELGHKLRGCYKCQPGQLLAEYDMSQAEVRFLAHESEDQVLCRIFHERDELTGKPRCMHRETAAKVFGVKSSEVTGDQRTAAKKVTFGIAYGQSGSGLETSLRTENIRGYDRHACDKLIREWMKLYKGAADYFRRVEQQVAKDGWVEDCWGMRRYLPAVWSSDKKLAAEARRQAVNHRIQGGAQGQIQKAMVYLRPIVRGWQKAGLNIKWALQIHDSLLFIMDEDLYEPVTEVVLDAMVNHCGVRLKVPVVADAKCARTWGDL